MENYEDSNRKARRESKDLPTTVKQRSGVSGGASRIRNSLLKESPTVRAFGNESRADDRTRRQESVEF